MTNVSVNIYMFVCDVTVLCFVTAALCYVTAVLCYVTAVLCCATGCSGIECEVR